MRIATCHLQPKTASRPRSRYSRQHRLTLDMPVAAPSTPLQEHIQGGHGSTFVAILSRCPLEHVTPQCERPLYHSVVFRVDGIRPAPPIRKYRRHHGPIDSPSRLAQLCIACAQEVTGLHICRRHSMRRIVSVLVALMALLAPIVHNTCFACHGAAKARDFVFNRYAP